MESADQVPLSPSSSGLRQCLELSWLRGRGQILISPRAPLQSEAAAVAAAIGSSGDRRLYTSPRAVTAQAIRPVLLAWATATRRVFNGTATTEIYTADAEVLVRARRITNVAPTTSSLRR